MGGGGVVFHNSGHRLALGMNDMSVDLLCFVLSCVCYVFVRVCLYVPCGHLLGKG